MKRPLKNFHSFIQEDQDIFNGKFSFAELPISQDRFFGAHRTI